MARIKVKKRTGGAKSIFVNQDVRIVFDGEGGDSYLVYNSSNNRIELFVDGTLQQDWG